MKIPGKCREEDNEEKDKMPMPERVIKVLDPSPKKKKKQDWVLTHCVQFDLACANCEEACAVVLPHKESFAPDVYIVECFICGGRSEVEAQSPELVGDDDGFWEWKPKDFKGEAKKADEEEHPLSDDTLSGGGETLEPQSDNINVLTKTNKRSHEAEDQKPKRIHSEPAKPQSVWSLVSAGPPQVLFWPPAEVLPGKRCSPRQKEGK